MRTIEIKGIRVHVPALIVSVVGVVIAVAVAPDAFVAVPAPSNPQNPAEAWATTWQTMKWISAFSMAFCALLLILSLAEGDDE